MCALSQTTATCFFFLSYCISVNLLHFLLCFGLCMFSSAWGSGGVFWLNPVSVEDQRAALLIHTALRLWLALLPCDPNPASIVHQRLDSGVHVRAVDPWPWPYIWISLQPWCDVEICFDYSATSTNLLLSCNESSMQKFVYIIGLWLWARWLTGLLGWDAHQRFGWLRPASSSSLLLFGSPIWMKPVVCIQ